MRQFQFRVGYENFALIHVSLVPDMHGEQKTKPTQTTVHCLRGLGLLPDLVIQPYRNPIFFWLITQLDRMPAHSTRTTQRCHKRQNIHVLSRQFRASLWSP